MSPYDAFGSEGGSSRTHTRSPLQSVDLHITGDLGIKTKRRSFCGGGENAGMVRGTQSGRFSNLFRSEGRLRTKPSS